MGIFKKIYLFIFNSHFSSYILCRGNRSFCELDKMDVVYKAETASLNLFNGATTIADAFLYSNEEKMWLFYELQEHLNSKGLLMSVSTTDGINWSSPKLILEENVHLSFPFVFSDKGNVYLIPETSFMHEVRIYKGKNDCTDFRYLKTLLSGERYVDSCLYVKDNVYYLFTSVQHEDNSYTLKLYLSDDILGVWKEHPCSPISTGKYCERNAGTIVEVDGMLFRPAQNNTKHYATNTHLYKIVELSPTNYCEEPYLTDILSPNFFSNIGGHQLSVCRFKGKEYVAVDVLQKSINLYSIYRKIYKKILQ